MDPFAQVHFVPYYSTTKPSSLTDWIRKVIGRICRPQSEKERVNPGQYSPCDAVSKSDEYRKLLGGTQTFAVFRNGTCVFSEQRIAKDEAIHLMLTEGPVVVGTRKGDFFVGRTKEPILGTIIRYHHPQIVSFVNESEYPLDCPDHVVGACARLARDCDSRDLHIVHYESPPDLPLTSNYLTGPTDTSEM